MTHHRLRCEQLFDGLRFFAPGFVEIRDGLVTHVGAEACFDVTETLPGLTLPGLPNLHSHAFQRAFAGSTERAVRAASGGLQESFWSWRERLYELVALLSPEDVEVVAEQAFVEMLEAGYTSVAEFHYLHHQADGTPYDDIGELGRRVAHAARHTGLRMALLPVFYETGGFGAQPLVEAQRRFFCDVDRFTTLYASLSDERDALISLGMAPHSLRAAPLAAISSLVSNVRAADPRAVIHIHIAEQQREVDECIAHHGLRPVELLLDRLPVDERFCLVHATHLSSLEVTRLARSGAVAGLCPSTEANLGDGLFPLRDFLAQGGRFGIGSDSQVSIQPVEELRWLEYGQRLTTQARNVVASSAPVIDAAPSSDVIHSGVALLQHALEGGARALGFGAAGLTVGAPADLIMLDPTHPSQVARHGPDAIDAWLFASNRPAIARVMVHGHFVVEGGVHVRREAVQARFERVLRRLRS